MRQLEIVPFDVDRHGELIAELTNMLHDAYRPLAEQGLRFLATHQSQATNLERLTKGKAWDAS